jgi:DNA polymerase-3 subunit gamma/tau
MSYLVLARKYRPMFFDEVVGQQHVTKTLQNAISQNRIANAYLFSGPRGVGKTTVARLLAKALNCEQGPTINPCNQCSSCIEINESRSLDVFEIDGASNRGIDEVRNLREGLRYSPNPGKHRIYIIDEVHMLTNEAFNALLKTLEEPPTRVLFIFATTEAHKVPATILSRCQRFDYKRITTRSIIEQLKSLCQQEHIEIDDESLRLIANKADGGMRDSESILDQIIAFAGMKICAQDVATLLGIINQELFFKVSDLIKKGDVQGGIDLASQIFTEGYDFNEFLFGLAEHFRNFLVAKTTGKAQELDVSEIHAQRYLTERDIFEIEDLLRLIKIASDAENLIRRSNNARLHLEVAIVKMIKLNKSMQLSQLLNELEELKKKPNFSNPASNNYSPGPIASTSKTHEPPTVFGSFKQTAAALDKTKEKVSAGADEPKKNSISLAEIEDRWLAIIDEVKKKKIALGSFLSEGWPTRIEENILEITFGANNGFHISSIEKNKEMVQTIIFEILGVRLRIRCLRDDQGILDKVRKVPARVDKKTVFETLVKENDMVKTIVETFDGELIK